MAGEIEAAGRNRLGRRLERGTQRDGLADRGIGAIPGRQGDRYAIRPLAGIEIAKGENAQGEPGPSLVAKRMRLDETRHVHVTELLRQNGSAYRLGAQLGGGEACGEGDRRAANTEAKRRMPGSKTEPYGTKQE